jgi:hypothetical protein
MENLFHTKGLKTYGAIGISQIAKHLYTALQAKTGFLNQYYILREQNTPYKIDVAPINNELSKSPI